VVNSIVVVTSWLTTTVVVIGAGVDTEGVTVIVIGDPATVAVPVTSSVVGGKDTVTGGGDIVMVTGCGAGGGGGGSGVTVTVTREPPVVIVTGAGVDSDGVMVIVTSDALTVAVIVTGG
jgi:hypothetical protein